MKKLKEFDIQNIINQMLEFQEEFDWEFKDWKTFWKHFYKKLDEVIFAELVNFIEPEEKKENKLIDKENKLIDIIKNFSKENWIDIEVEEIIIK